MWRGQLTFEPPMLYTIGFLVVFLPKMTGKMGVGIREPRLTPPLSTRPQHFRLHK